MTTPPSPGVRSLLGLLGLPLGTLALVAFVAGISFVRPSWLLLGLAATLHTFVLLRVTAAMGPSADRTTNWATSFEGLLGFAVVLVSLWGMLQPPGAPGPATGPLVMALGIGAAAAYVAGRYAADTPGLPEGPALGRWARLTVWASALVAVDVALVVAGWPIAWVVDAVARALLLLVAALGFEVVMSSQQRGSSTGGRSGSDPSVLRWLFSRWNPLASLGDAVQHSLGVDLRTTWAIQFLRAAVEPMVVGVAVVSWLCTSLVQVGPEEVAIHERLGRPVSTEPRGPGLHIVAPWPIDRLRRVPVQRVSTMSIGAEHGDEEDEEEEEGPEDTLWAKMHADEEYTLLLGDGRDLVTLDGLLHYRIADPYVYLYGAQNPEEGLRAAAYEALTRRTVGRSLDAVLSENLSAFADEVVADIRRRAADLDLGLEPVSFTLKGLHPPFAVAADYQAVVSAQIEQKTSVILAHAYRLRHTPNAKSIARLAIDDARATEASTRAEAIGEAEAFRALVESYRAAPGLYRFQRRMETLELNLANREFTIVDRRFEAQGGDLWILR
ncbi:MAG: protease modulator HflK [Myxococcota bacterium]